MLNAELPAGMTRSPDLYGFVTLDNCQALRLFYREDHAQIGAVLSDVVVWKGKRSAVTPLDRRCRMRDLRPGDRIDVLGSPATLVEVEIYR